MDAPSPLGPNPAVLMARPPLELETWGRIRRTTVNGKHAAVAYYRDSDGITRPMQRQGKTPAEAERNLVKALKKRLAPVSEDLTPDTTIDVLARKWLDSRTRLAEGSVRIYRNAIEKHIVPGIGSVRLGEATVPKLDRFISALSRSSGPGTATTARVVLAGMFTLATRHGAVRSNPMQDVPAPEKAKRRGRAPAPNIEIIRDVRARFEAWDAGTEPRPDGDRRRRQPRASVLLDTVDMIIGTGVRTGELLALQWSSLDLVDHLVTIERTIAQDRDGKFFVQEFTKTDAGYRQLELPVEVTAMLLRRSVAAYTDLVFPSSVGTLRHPNNYRTAWRAALAETRHKGLTPKSFRKAVATFLRDELGLQAAKEQLGHEHESTTQRHYADELHRGPAVGAIMSKLFST
ncbi:site-specific integrase [Microbacterium sp. BG28]|uniref:tyrosine-type recombinase/integrase n=1 Tax=Microbacterium sp. BG28 TaxID=3097356 RepID=UPI002A5994D6|nr:site-specific integrase [Microbacterium sp. BG28]MDY0830769.1 site-specific integrase [Microbacterium sp. BG28]